MCLHITKEDTYISIMKTNHQRHVEQDYRNIRKLLFLILDMEATATTHRM
jgi:hypothetical protein